MGDYFEPWTTTRDTTWEPGFRFPPVESECRTADDVRAWWSAKAKAEDDAAANLWGSGMAEPTPCRSLLGTETVMDGRRIIGSFRKHVHDGPSHVDLARRAVECVNACQGIRDPGRAIAIARELVGSIRWGEALENLLDELSDALGEPPQENAL